VHETTLSANKDSLPMKITYQDLKEKCQSYVEQVTEKKKFSVDKYIDMVRADNTIYLNRLGEKDSVFAKYSELFFKNYMTDVAKLLESSVSKGLGYHSEKYNLDIGGAAPNANSYFKIK
jgi:hypothetical protein